MIKRNFQAAEFLSRKPALSEIPEYFQSYILRVPEGNIFELLEQQELVVIERFRELEAQIDVPYSEGKWTIRQVLIHLNDVERVFQYRMLSGIRENGAKLPGFDHDKWADEAANNKQDMNSLLLEFQAIRSSSLSLLSGITEQQLSNTIYRDQLQISILGISNLLWGHIDHHLSIMDTYLK